MKQSSWSWVQRVLRGASKGSHGHSTPECTCLGRRDVASTASVSGLESCDRPRSLLLHTSASQGNADILRSWQYGTRGQQVRGSHKEGRMQLPNRRPIFLVRMLSLACPWLAGGLKNMGCGFCSWNGCWNFDGEYSVEIPQT